jgi:hypothetical protein
MLKVVWAARLSRTWISVFTVAFSCVLLGCGSSSPSIADRHLSACSLGEQLGEGRQLLAPRPNTFYSVDVLNPDIVAFHGRYFMYFSGNDRHTPKGEWSTGLAIARSPTGPFHVQEDMEGNYLNGGTTVWQGHLWHIVEDNPVEGTDVRSELSTSNDGIHWHHQSFLPEFATKGTAYRGADFFLEPKGSRLGVYMLAVPPAGGIGRSLAFASFSHGQWSNFHIILNIKSVASLPWARADLGEPATFYANHMHYLLFVGLAQDGLTRSVGLARETASGWRVCSDDPATPNGARWGPASSIDPSPLVVDHRLYLYYGATRTAGLAANLGGSIGVRIFVQP